MGATWNGNYVATNQDFWNVVGDMQKTAVNNNRVVPVLSTAERDGLATSAPDNVIPDGTVVVRLDRNGAFDIRVDGSWIEGDSDWVNMTYASGYTAGVPGQLAYKTTGSTLHIKGGATGVFPVGDYMQVSTTFIPPRFRPSDTQYFGAGVSGGHAGGIQISQQGFIQLVSQVQPNWISAACTMPLS